MGESPASKCPFSVGAMFRSGIPRTLARFGRSPRSAVSSLGAVTILPCVTLPASYRANSTDESSRSTRLARVRAENQVLNKLRKLEGLDEDLVGRGIVKQFTADVDAGIVAFHLQPTKGGVGDTNPDGATLQKLCEEEVRKVDWVTSVQVTLLPAKANPKKGAKVEGAAKHAGLAGVKRIIAVASCKGGVGKSTVSVNLATALSQLGLSVGIFDADVYGPSLPTMAGIQAGSGLRPSLHDEKLIEPFSSRDGKLKLMSYGFAQDGSAIMRGPMVGNVVTQLVTTTDWGDLDYLVLDLPPGTGDIQLSLCQTINLDASVVVTTPQQISLVDVVKGIVMFQKLKVPTVAVVENMAHFDCDHGERYYPFGRGSSEVLVNQFGFPHSCTLPIEPLLSLYSDIGCPMTAQDSTSEVAEIFRGLAGAVDSEITKLQELGGGAPVVSVCPDTNHILAAEAERDLNLSPKELRLKCKCALCVDEFSGVVRVQPGDIPHSLAAKTIEPKGNYAVEIIWNDGHQSIFPYTTFFDEQ